jgi:hypothetical protein
MGKRALGPSFIKIEEAVLYPLEELDRRRLTGCGLDDGIHAT